MTIPTFNRNIVPLGVIIQFLAVISPEKTTHPIDSPIYNILSILEYYVYLFIIIHYYSLLFIIIHY